MGGATRWLGRIRHVVHSLEQGTITRGIPTRIAGKQHVNRSDRAKIAEIINIDRVVAENHDVHSRRDGLVLDGIDKEIWRTGRQIVQGIDVGLVAHESGGVVCGRWTCRSVVYHDVISIGGQGKITTVEENDLVVPFIGTASIYKGTGHPGTSRTLR